MDNSVRELRLNSPPLGLVIQMAGTGLPNGGGGPVFVIACAGVVGWLLLITVTLCLGVAAKRGDELSDDASRYLSDSGEDAKVIPLRRHQTDADRAPAWCGKRCD
jgi:hypothetical protein